MSEDDAGGLTNFISSVINAPIILVLRDRPAPAGRDGGIVKGSYRTVSNDIDVAKMAQVYNGGGHKKAAGFSVEGTIKETANEWVIELKNSDIR